MASRLKSSQVRKGAKALQPLALVAFVGIIGTVTLLGGCGGTNSFSNNNGPSPFVPVPVGSSGSGATPTPTPTPSGSSGSGATPTPTPTPTPSGGASPTPTPSPTPTLSALTLTQALDALKANAGATITTLALGPDDGWAVAYTVAAIPATGTTPAVPMAYGYYVPVNAPASLRTALDGLVASKANIRSITLGTGDVWLITYSQASSGYTDYLQNGINATMLSRLISLRLNQNVIVKSAIIGADSSVWALIVNQNLNYSQGLPAGLQTQLNTFASNGSITIDHIALGADKTYAVSFNINQIVGTASGLVNTANGKGFTISGIGLGLAGDYVVTYNQNQYLSSGTTRSR